MISVSEVIEIMGVVAACHHRTAPRMDDRDAVLVTAQVWANLFDVYNLDAETLKAAVMKRAAVAAEAPEPAEIISFAREIRRERAERETAEQRRAREELLDAKAEGRLAAVTQLGQRFELR